MPNPHFDVQVISRRAGQSVVAAAAYRSGEILYDEKAGKTFDYSRKEDIVHVEIITPAGTSAWASDRSLLWNKVEAFEKRKDAQLARSVIAVLPRELDKEQNLALVRDYIKENFISQGMVADFAIHESDAEDGLKNPHAHILITMRPFKGQEFGQKNRDWNHIQTLKGWRNSWEVHTNRSLEQAGSMERVSLKSFKEQGKNQHPTIHMGEDTWNLEQRGVETNRGNKNRKVKHENALIEILTHAYAAGFEVDSENLGAVTDIKQIEESNRDLSQNGAKFSTADFNFSDANATNRLEAMTLELKDEQADHGSMGSNVGDKSGGKKASMGAFKNDEADPEKLAMASLEASRAVHDAALSQYLQSTPYQSTTDQVMLNTRLKDYARRGAEKIKGFGEKVYRQFTNLRKETERLRERDRGNYER